MEISDLDRLIAIEAVKRLKSRRDRALDTKDWATFRSLHAPEHESANDGFASWKGRDTLVERSMALLSGMTTVHQCHTPDIVIDAPDRASAVWYLEDQLYWTQDDEEHWIHGFGFYHERSERRDGEWVFTHRRLQRTLLFASPGAEHPAIAGAKAAGVFRAGHR
ncbi:nuclear transport factor 2 family protein [Herbiconiux ginsengi]|uniref:SnoaL-like domain-containing protein n=1 Tax=Herbiconiux ginsengi TaxID=381665 RepID=A0A1H3TG56_9MICO|nr:nuclear transport factor 2 family protein [Herbiconiux ginsengi]SDZ49080.1 SnoaL-like domain-containing protein [Herbiconiux ginsengi]